MIPRLVYALSVRNSDMVRANVNENLNVLSVERKITRASIVRTIRNAPIVVNLTWLHPKIVNISLEKDIGKMKSCKESVIFY
jgi:DNA-binding GntR family transcriptional regulator